MSSFLRRLREHEAQVRAIRAAALSTTEFDQTKKCHSLYNERHQTDQETESIPVSPQINDLACVTHYISPEIDSSLYNERHCSATRAATAAPSPPYKGVIWPEEPPAAAYNAAPLALAESEYFEAEPPEPKSTYSTANELREKNDEKLEAKEIDVETGEDHSKKSFCPTTVDEISGEGANQTVPAAPAPTLPRLSAATRIHAQVFRRSTDPNDKRRGFRNVKFYTWTTDDMNLLNDHDHMASNTVFNLVSPDVFLKAVQKNKRAGTIGPKLASNLELLAKHVKANNSRIISTQHEKSTMAYLKVKGARSGVAGTEIKPDQVCVLEWTKQDDGSYLPTISMFLIASNECEQIECIYLPKNKFNYRAAEYVGYYDPLDYNSYRKGKKKKPLG